MGIHGAGRAVRVQGLRAAAALGDEAQSGGAQRFASSGFRVGEGGRSSVGKHKVTVFGATGMVGRYVVNALGKAGNTVMIPYRGDDLEWRHLKLMGDLGKINPMPYSVRDEESVRDAIRGSDIVINLVGKRYETQHFLPFITNFSFYDVNVRAATTIAQLAKECGVERLVHVSALSASQDSLSEWARTKAIGEESVRSIFPEATIIRPATLFGPEDTFLNTMAYLARCRVPGVRTFVIGDGKQKVQPLWANDAGLAIANAATAPDALHGKTFSLAGNKVFTMREVADFVLETIQTQHACKSVSPLVAEAIGAQFEVLPNPRLTRDEVRRWQDDVYLEDKPGILRIQDLDVEPVSMEKEAFNFLHRYRRGGHFVHASADE